MLPDLLFLLVGLVFLLILAYLFFLAIVSLRPEKQAELSRAELKFALIIPAHNEAELIGATLAQAHAVNYPDSLYEIIVVADSCDDDTEKIALQAGVTCWPRCDPALSGKGNVLKWVFPRLLEYGDHDVFVVLDADTHMDKDFLLRVNHHIMHGAQVVQGYSQVRHPGDSPMESLAFLGFALSRNLRYRGRSKLGWTSNLLGTGMCFGREVIAKYGWNTTSMVEDIEYEMMLHLHGVRVFFASDAEVTVELHNSLDHSKGQRTRWDIGKFTIRNTYVPRLLKEGFRRRDLSCFDSAMELLLPPFALLCVIVLAFSGLFFLFGYHGVNLNLFIWSAVGIGFLLYILIGLITARAGRRVYWSLLYAPFFMLWRCWIVCHESFTGNKERTW
jgi:cellulose synthase/poly-beta-1,6-N-acetylglucosamine synthase-like glycosyltransferase